MPDPQGNATVSVHPTPSDLMLKLNQDGANVNLVAVDSEGNEKFFGRLIVFEGNHGGHIEPRLLIIADDLELIRENERMKVS